MKHFIFYLHYFTGKIIFNYAKHGPFSHAIRKCGETSSNVLHLKANEIFKKIACKHNIAF